jgi:hypothetical protein
MATLDAAAIAMMALVRAIPTIKSAPDYPPEKPGAFPFAVVYPGRGRVDTEVTGAYRNLATLILEVHITRKNLPLSVETVFPMLDRLANVLCDPDNVTLSGTVSLIETGIGSPGIPWVFGELNWAEVETVGYRLDVTVKQENII